MATRSYVILNLTHVNCATCGWSYQGVNAQGLGKLHAMHKNHKVQGEVAALFSYDYSSGVDETITKEEKKNGQ